MHPNRRDLLALSGAALAGSVAGCLGDLAPGPAAAAPTLLQADRDRETGPDVPAGDLSAVVRANAAFGLDLHRWLVERSPDGNLLTSPFSISVALAMTWAGARAETERTMAEALRFPLPQASLHPAYNALDLQVDGADGSGDAGDGTGGADDGTGDGGDTGGHGSDDGRVDTDGDGTPDATPFALETANSLWGQAGFPFRDGFLERLAVHYGAGLRTLDFESSPEKARATINHWVAGETAGTIEELLPEGVVDSRTRLVLTNAIYFRANWLHTFEASATEPRPFTALDGTTAEVPTMHQDADLPYAEVDGTQVLELPYVGGEVGMVLLLPPAGSFASFERSLSAETLLGYFDGLETRHGEVALPRFSAGARTGLKDALSGLGMSTAFDPNRADFSGMVEASANRPLVIRDVLHETHIDVDETGTEAAAATGAVLYTVSLPVSTFEFRADRPFLYAIRHRPTDAVLFLGRVVDAGAAQG